MHQYTPLQLAWRELFLTITKIQDFEDLFDMYERQQAQGVEGGVSFSQVARDCLQWFEDCWEPEPNDWTDEVIAFHSDALIKLSLVSIPL